MSPIPNKHEFVLHYLDWVRERTSPTPIGQWPSDYFLLANQSPRSCALPTDLSKKEVNLSLQSPIALFAVAKGHCTERHQVWVFLFGPGPVFLLFCLIFEAKRKSGWGMCGSSCFGCLFCLCVLDMPTFLILANCAQYDFFFTAYVSITTVPQSIYGQTRDKKIYLHSPIVSF